MRIAVIGAGVMGTGIAQVLATASHTVACFDATGDQLARAHHLVVHGRYGLNRGVERGKVSAAQADGALRRLTFTDSVASAAERVELVIEAIPEDLGLKMALFKELDDLTPPNCILASNTSGLPIAALAAATSRPGRVIGWHWASPAVVMRMAEIAITDRTEKDVIDTVVTIAAGCGKRPVVVKENVQAWGFAANRVVTALLREARQVVAEGIASEEDLDQLLVDGWGWPAGPFQMIAGAADGWGDNRGSSISRTHRS